MKKLSIFIAILAVAALTGCATMIPIGGLYTATKLPGMATSNSGAALKTGEAQCTSIMGLVAYGDCSISTAKKNGNINTVHSVDWDAKNILGIYGTYKVIVTGQ